MKCWIIWQVNTKDIYYNWVYDNLIYQANLCKDCCIKFQASVTVIITNIRSISINTLTYMFSYWISGPFNLQQQQRRYIYLSTTGDLCIQLFVKIFNKMFDKPFVRSCKTDWVVDEFVNYEEIKTVTERMAAQFDL